MVEIESEETNIFFFNPDKEDYWEALSLNISKLWHRWILKSVRFFQ
jgi:hypothetical protein